MAAPGSPVRWVAAGAAVLIIGTAAVLLRSIGGNSQPPLVTTPTIPPATATPGVSPTVGPPPEIVGPLFAYSHEAGLGRQRPVREIVFYDLGAGHEAWSFEYGGAGHRAGSELVAGNSVILQTSAGVRVTDLYGGNARTLIDFADGQRFWGMGASSDNHYLAVSTSRDDRGDWQIDVVDIGTGEIIHTVPSTHTALDGFVGVPGRITWQPGNHAFAVVAATESEMPGDVAIFGLDGTVRMWKTDGYPILSPNGTRVAWTATFANDCYWDNPPLGEDLTLVDLVSGTKHVLPLGPRVGPVQWSPNSAWFLYDLYSPVAGSCDWVKTPIASMRVDFLSTASVSVPTRESTLREWNSDPLIEMDCGDGAWQIVDRYWDGRRVAPCGESGRIRVNSVAIGEGAGTVFFGFVSGPARPGDERTVVYERKPDLTGVREVVAYNIATAEQRLITGAEGPVDAQAGLVVIASGRRLTIFDVRGQRPPYDLVIGDGARVINDVAFSRDGTLIGVAMGDRPGEWNADILRTDDGSLVARIDSATEAPIGAPDAYPGWLHWRADGRGVVVQGGVGRDGPAGMLTFWIDGTVTRVENPGFATVSPDGRLAVVGIDSDETPNCLFINSHSFRISDLETLGVLAEVDDPERVFNRPSWDSASREVVLRSYEPPFDEACAWTRQELGFATVDTATGALSDPGDPSPITASWSDVSVRCDGVEQPLTFDRFFARRGDCPSDAATQELLVDGIVVDTAGASYTLLGIVD